MFLSVILFSFLSLTSFQQESSITKRNGDLIVLKELKIIQGNGIVSDSELVFTSNGQEMKQTFEALRRLNLKEDLQKKKGVVTWDAMLVKADDEKLEIQIEIAKITGVNESGNLIEIPSGSINKIIF